MTAYTRATVDTIFTNLTFEETIDEDTTREFFWDGVKIYNYSLINKTFEFQVTKLTINLIEYTESASITLKYDEATDEFTIHFISAKGGGRQIIDTVSGITLSNIKGELDLKCQARP